MTQKKSNNGQFAPASKQHKPEKSGDTSHLIGAVLSSTAWFITIWLAAVAIGMVVDWTETYCSWVPHPMILVGHITEYVIFGADVICLLWSVCIHLYRHCKGELDRVSNKKDESKK